MRGLVDMEHSENGTHVLKNEFEKKWTNRVQKFGEDGLHGNKFDLAIHQ